MPNCTCGLHQAYRQAKRELLPWWLRWLPGGEAVNARAVEILIGRFTDEGAGS